MRDSHRVPRVLHALILSLLVALSLTGTALAADDDVPAYQVYDSLLESSSSVQEFNARIMGDLAGRWFFASSDKQVSIPVVQKAYHGIADGSLPKLLEDNDGDPSNAYVAFMFIAAFSGVAEPFPLITQVYGLVTLEGGVAWDSSSSGARERYREWYEYFEGPSSGGSGGSGSAGAVLPSSVVLEQSFGTHPVGSAKNGENMVPASSLVPITINISNVGTFNNRPEAYKYIVLYDNVDNYYGAANEYNYCTCFYMGSDSEITFVPFYEASIKVGTGYVDSYRVRAASESDIYVSNGKNLGSKLNASGMTFNLSLSTTVTNKGTTTDLYGWGNNLPSSYGTTGYWFSSGFGDPFNGEPSYPTLPSIPLPSLPTGGPSPNVNVPLTTQPTYEGNGTSTTTVDLTPILEALRTINTNLVTGFDHFEDAVNDQFTALQGYLQTWFEWWKDFFTGWRDTWQEWERDFMRECNRANSWLERIYYKTGSGTSSRPDPSVKPVETVNWWDALAQKFLSMLPAAVQDIVSQLSRLNGVFPFSIPWDVGAILGLFSQPAATPIFDLTIPNVDGSTWTARINLTQWNGVALVIRRCVLFSFAIQLMMWTPDVIKQLGVS